MTRSRFAALALGLAALTGTPALAQSESPGLRGLQQVRTYMGFVGRPEALAACGVTPALETSLYDAMRLTLNGAGVRSNRTYELRTPESWQRVLVGTPVDPAVPTLGIAISVLSINTGGSTVCSLHTDIRVSAEGSARVNATGAGMDGTLILWTDDSSDLTMAANGPAELRESVEEGMRDFVAAYGTANGRPTTGRPAGVTGPAPAPAPQGGGGKPAAR